MTGFEAQMEHLETKSCACQSDVIFKHTASFDRHAGVGGLLDRPSELPCTKRRLLSLKWQQLAAGAERKGIILNVRGDKRNKKGVNGRKMRPERATGARSGRQGEGEPEGQ